MKLMTHLVAGFPNLETTRELIIAMQTTGADMLEIQIPFSDPLGDGPVIREACAVALKNGLKVQAVFDLLRTMQEKNEITKPLYIMAYFNSVYYFGIEKFCSAAKNAGAEGLIIPDYNSEAEAYDHLFHIADKYNISCIQFLSLDSTKETVAHVAKTARGFVYCFSMRGITGSESANTTELLQKLKHLKQKISTPLAVGFGISAPDQVKMFKGYADVIIVGSALIRAYQSGGLDGVKQLILGLKQAT